MTEVCAQCHHDESAPYIRFCAGCQGVERRIINRAEKEGWLGSDRVRAAVMHLHGGSGFYVLALHQFAIKTGWLPHHVQSRPCCPKMITDGHHRPSIGCWAASWPVQIDHEVVMSRGRGQQLALLSQPYGPVKPTDKPYLVDTPAPYGPRARPLLLTASALARGTADPAAPAAARGRTP